MLWLNLLLIAHLSSCYPSMQNGFTYRLDDPDQTFTLPQKLTEISGLGLAVDGKNLIAVQDEEGILFFINKENGKEERSIKFWEKGDYEGVEMVSENIYVVKSTGTIYRIAANDRTSGQTEKYNLFLDEENDVEGLSYDAANNRLLLACKAKAGQGQDFTMKKGIYSFDLATYQLSESPVFTVTLGDVLNYLSRATYLEDQDKLLEHFTEDADEFAFAPSAIAVHPLSGQIYILSSVGKLVMVLDVSGKIIHIEKLKKKVHPQPEGLCFDHDGTMYVANEGKDDELGRIHIFKMN